MGSEMGSVGRLKRGGGRVMGMGMGMGEVGSVGWEGTRLRWRDRFSFGF